MKKLLLCVLGCILAFPPLCAQVFDMFRQTKELSPILDDTVVR